MAEPEEQKNPWLQKVIEAMSSSTTYVDANYRKQWEDNLRAFQSKHHADSKYNHAAYKHRSRVFRPKPRAAERQNEAAAATAFFSNPDYLNIEAQNPEDDFQLASADINQELLQYRLTKTIPWYMTLIGGFQDANVIGVVASIQSWKYETKPDPVEVTFDDGSTERRTRRKVTRDEPDVQILPVENIRIHPAANWRDPVNSSPYLIILWPMHVVEVRARMKQTDDKTGQPKWHHVEDDALRGATKLNFDSTRLVRQKNREDPEDDKVSGNLKDYDIVWIPEVFMWDEDGNDMHFFTAGTEHMLSDPEPIEEAYFTGERPVVIGSAIIETHRIYPTSMMELGQNLSREKNDITNSRLDNIKLVLNKRYFVRRGAQVDLKSMMRNQAGSVTFVDDVDKDVRDFDFNDVTSSSFQEQDRLDVEHDELVGNFSTSSVANNRKLNETVGGMRLMAGSTNALTEYLIRTVAETWVIGVLRQLIKLEQKYETDEVILAIAANKAQLYQKYGISRVTDELLNQELTATVNVGIGATDPMLKLERFLLAADKMLAIAQQQAELLQADPNAPRLDMAEVQKEIFGLLGHSDGSRFIVKPPEEGDEQTAQLMQIIEQMQQEIGNLTKEIESNSMDNETKAFIQQMKEDGMDRRLVEQSETEIEKEMIKLANPVSGETIQ